eukprot:284817538_5
MLAQGPDGRPAQYIPAGGAPFVVLSPGSFLTSAGPPGSIPAVLPAQPMVVQGGGPQPIQWMVTPSVAAEDQQNLVPDAAGEIDERVPQQQYQMYSQQQQPRQYVQYPGGREILPQPVAYVSYGAPHALMQPQPYSKIAYGPGYPKQVCVPETPDMFSALVSDSSSGIPAFAFPTPISSNGAATGRRRRTWRQLSRLRFFLDALHADYSDNCSTVHHFHATRITTFSNRTAKLNSSADQASSMPKSKEAKAAKKAASKDQKKEKQLIKAQKKSAKEQGLPADECDIQLIL